MNLCVLFLSKGEELAKRKLFADVQTITLSSEQITLEDIKADYLLFVDQDVQIDEGFLTPILSNLSSDVDFLQLTPKQAKGSILKREDVFLASYENITALKVIKKSVLSKLDYFDIGTLDRPMLTDLYFDLFQEPLTFNTIESGYQFLNKVDVESVQQEVELITHLLFEKTSADRRKFLVLYKRALIKRLFKLADTKAFAELIPYSEQEDVLRLFREVLLDIDDPTLTQMDLDGYIPFVQMIRAEYYTEGIYYLRLMRGKRYWFNRSKKLNKKVKRYPIADSTSWKVSAPLRKGKNICKNIRNTCMKIGLSLLSLPVKLRYAGQDAWLVSERPDQAEDNGYAFFKYCREKHPNKKVFYLIDKDSPHMDKVQTLGNVIIHSSLKHWLYMLTAKKYISAWVFDEFSLPKGSADFKELFASVYEKTPQITLQHGVIIHNIAPYLSKAQYNQQLFIASSEAEKEVIKQTLGYEDQDVVVTGLSRFDNLHNLSVKKQILIMPTWRRSIFNLNKSQFLRSLYFNRYYQLVRNEQLLKVLEEKQIVLKFYVHSQMQKFLPEFAFEHPNVQFLTKQDAIVSELLKESSLLVTDYSSVMADFLYMDKSVLLYQFDPYDNHHGPVQQISYDDFGEVFDDEARLVEAITQSINADFKISPEYQAKSNTFFAHKDQQNSARIFKAINDLKGARK
ncbi:CDP-glycerol glycerophosphotransferase family protein [Peribacillus sp. FSL H8-0477]|uniref:CDP-glycerol glycerophosphotransferase family protein n=1 Tax=Peribacillus sp. FSL H8-0477 TaxID=2921388 RepID=UPI0030F72B35